MEQLEADVARALRTWDAAVTMALSAGAGGDKSSGSSSSSSSSSNSSSGGNSSNSSSNPSAGGARRPWDYEAFLKRRDTLRPTLWFGKPRRLRSAVCAAHGWEARSELESLRCAMCHTTLRYSPPAGVCAAEEEAYVASFERELGDAHRPACAWRRSYLVEQIASELVRRHDAALPTAAQPEGQRHDLLGAQQLAGRPDAELTGPLVSERVSTVLDELMGL
jgi:hypothetical protein